MLTRRHVREVAVQLLYNICQENSHPQNAEITDSLWETLLEKEIIFHVKNSRKVLIHLLQGRPQALNSLLTPSETFLAYLSTVEGQQQSIIDLKTVLRLEDQLSKELSLIVKRKNNRKEIEASELFEIFKTNQELNSLRPKLISSLTEQKTIASRGEQLISGLKKLQKLSEVVLLIEDPSKSENFKEISHLKESHKTIHGLKLEAAALAKGVLTHQEAIDTKLADILDNYSLERISQTDRAILRLASYEILHRENIPGKVSINEAIELAKIFGTSESASFVNGILDQLFKLSPASSST